METWLLSQFLSKPLYVQWFRFVCRLRATASFWEHWDLSVINCWEGKMAVSVKSGRLKGGKTPLPPDNASGCRGRQPKTLRGLGIMNSHCVFVFPSPSTLPCTVLSSSCTEQHVNCCSTSAANISKLQRRQRARPGLVFMVRWNVNSGREKRGEVIMRHPPSAGCLFGQTGCLTAQAVDGILMDMTNDSLSPLFLSPDSFMLDSLLSLLLLPFPPSGCNFKLSS